MKTFLKWHARHPTRGPEFAAGKLLGADGDDDCKREQKNALPFVRNAHQHDAGSSRASSSTRPFYSNFPEFSRCFWARHDSSDSVLSNAHLPRPTVPKNRGWDEEMHEGRPGCGEETRFTACHGDAAAAWGCVTDVTLRDSRCLCHDLLARFPPTNGHDKPIPARAVARRYVFFVEAH